MPSPAGHPGRSPVTGRDGHFPAGWQAATEGPRAPGPGLSHRKHQLVDAFDVPDGSGWGKPGDVTGRNIDQGHVDRLSVTEDIQSWCSSAGVLQGTRSSATSAAAMPARVPSFLRGQTCWCRWRSGPGARRRNPWRPRGGCHRPPKDDDGRGVPVGQCPRGGQRIFGQTVAGRVEHVDGEGDFEPVQGLTADSAISGITAPGGGGDVGRPRRCP
ncbi:MAG: hypothetical protein Ct9H300mP1_02720 [Planctomycetaceae bacterium]|nr:MAG: hypothetical protein Ct9H300mP1_02720 [Planctomycetaceae bacterium]